ncbi:tRNA (adenosine(37)-N6)-threonylcarbamoyltransferase complex dimerization subunit type 1 TsaB [Streptomyces sp. NPDC003691]
MLLLAVDTATPAVTAALHDGTKVLAESSRVDARRHGELLLPAVDRVLAEAGTSLDAVTAVVTGTGPGPYTGLRVGLVTAATFGSALGVPVYGLCTLDGLAWAAARDAGVTGPFVVATDARRKEVYWAVYDSPRERVTGPYVDRPADIADRVAGLPAVGAGALLYPDTFTTVVPGGPEHASAAALASLAAELLAEGAGLPEPVGAVGAAESAAAGEAAAGVAVGTAGPAGVGFLPPQPLYLRRPDAQVPKNYKVVTPQ